MFGMTGRPVPAAEPTRHPFQLTETVTRMPVDQAHGSRGTHSLRPVVLWPLKVSSGHRGGISMSAVISGVNPKQ